MRVKIALVVALLAAVLYPFTIKVLSPEDRARLLAQAARYDQISVAWTALHKEADLHYGKLIDAGLTGFGQPIRQASANSSLAMFTAFTQQAIGLEKDGPPLRHPPVDALNREAAKLWSKFQWGSPPPTASIFSDLATRLGATRNIEEQKRLLIPVAAVAGALAEKTGYIAPTVVDAANKVRAAAAPPSGLDVIVKNAVIVGMLTFIVWSMLLYFPEILKSMGRRRRW